MPLDGDLKPHLDVDCGNDDYFNCRIVAMNGTDSSMSLFHTYK